MYSFKSAQEFNSQERAPNPGFHHRYRRPLLRRPSQSRPVNEQCERRHHLFKWNRKAETNHGTSSSTSRSRAGSRASTPTNVAELAEIHVERVTLGIFVLFVFILPPRKIGFHEKRVFAALDQSGPPALVGLLFLQNKVARSRRDGFFGFLRYRGKLTNVNDVALQSAGPTSQRPNTYRGVNKFGKLERHLVGLAVRLPLEVKLLLIKFNGLVSNVAQVDGQVDFTGSLRPEHFRNEVVGHRVLEKVEKRRKLAAVVQHDICHSMYHCHLRP